MHCDLIVIAHRGASSSAPENTVAAVMAAVSSGADMVELDVQMTRDQRLVVFHDEDLGRTSDGAGRLADRLYDDLKGLDAGFWFHPKFAGERIPLLEEILAAIPPSLAVNLELKKTRRVDEFVTQLLRVLEDTDRFAPDASSPIERWPLLSSSELPLLRRCGARNLPIALVTEGKPSGGLQRAARSRCRAWHPCHTDLSPQLIETAHSHGLKVNTWTVDDIERMEELTRWGVDGMFTNVPEVLRELVCRWSGL